MNANSRAFPVGIAASALAPEYLQEGMSLRDYFAAKAMQSMMVNAGRNGIEFEHLDGIAKNAYAQADAMMQERLRF